MLLIFSINVQLCLIKPFSFYLFFPVQAFHCRHGKAYLFNNVVNVSAGPQEDRMMTTGKHTVADIYCNCCQQLVGWKYESAYEKTQKYKEGKFILERAKMIDGDGSDFYLDTHHVGSDADDE
jgi:hypothetical protein